MKSENITDYVGNFVYENGELSFILMPEGRILLDNSTNSITFNYYIKDHLGNTRTIIDDTGEILEANSYYPFGMQINALSYSSAEPENRYLYNGKELIKDFGLDLYYYGARNYDPQIARWSAVDPLAEKYLSQSPYNYVANRPIIMVDPNGMSAIIPPDSYEDVSETGQQRFEAILHNISSLTENESMMSAMMKTTGLNENEIKEQLEYGKGPKVRIETEGSLSSYAEAEGPFQFYIGSKILNNLGSISETNTNELGEQSFGVAMIVIDEFTHCGDKQTNVIDGKHYSSGQYRPGQEIMDPDDQIRKGSQYWGTSPMFHRGGDPQVYGYGGQVSIFLSGKTEFKNNESPFFTPLNAPKIKRITPQNKIKTGLDLLKSHQ